MSNGVLKEKDEEILMKNADLIIRDMQITEKGTNLAEKENKYFFRVAPSANKIEIKSAIEQLFNVAVVKVNTMKYVGKKKRERSLKYGKRADWKRAVVTLAEGNKIEMT